IPAPKQDRINPFDLNKEEKSSFATLLPDSADAKEIQRIFEGLGRDTADELSFLMQKHQSNVQDATRLFLNRLEDEQLAPTLTIQDKKELFTPIPYESLKGMKQSFSSLSALCDRYYEKKS